MDRQTVGWLGAQPAETTELSGTAACGPESGGPRTEDAPPEAHGAPTAGPAD